MNTNTRRVQAIFRKELREYRRNGFIIWTMAIIPALFCVQPLIQVFALPASAAAGLSNEHVLLYLLGIPALVPAFVAAYAVAASNGRVRNAATSPSKLRASSETWDFDRLWMPRVSTRPSTRRVDTPRT